MASEAFLRRNPRYREAEWKSRGPRERKPNVQVSNLDTFFAKQAGAPSERGAGGDAFAGDSSAEGVARRLAETGRRTGFGGVGIEPNRNLSPRERRQNGLDRRPGETRTPAGPTEDQRKWAKSFRESRSRAPLRSAAGPVKPLNFSRSAMVEGAKRSGDFVKTRGDFNKQSAAAQTGMRMNDRGGMDSLNKTTAGADGLTPYAREKFGPGVEDIRARRDFATGKSTTTSGTTGMVKQDNGARPTQAQDFRREITSKYGSGSNITRTPGQGGGTMVDSLTGKPVSMTGALADQSAVQKTGEGTSGRGEDRTFNKAGEDYFDPKKLRQSMQKPRGRV